MTPTSVSLLDRLKAARPDDSDWGKLQDIYLPLISRWLRRIPGLGNESDDLAQEVFVVMVGELPRFERQREGSFRAWLRQVTVNKVRTFRKQLGRKPRPGLDQTDGFLDQLADPGGELGASGTWTTTATSSRSSWRPFSPISRRSPGTLSDGSPSTAALPPKSPPNWGSKSILFCRPSRVFSSGCGRKPGSFSAKLFFSCQVAPLFGLSHLVVSSCPIQRGCFGLVAEVCRFPGP